MMPGQQTDSLCANLDRTLATLGAVDPQTDAPYSPAMIYGLSGGIGAGYILWEFTKSNTAPLVLGLSHRWNYPQDRLAIAAARTGLQTTSAQTTSETKAAIQLGEACADDPTAPLVQVDWLHCPFGWTLRATPAATGKWLVEDCRQNGLTVDQAVLAKARAATPSSKNRLTRFTGLAQQSLPAHKQHCTDALTQLLDTYGGKSDSFALPAWRKWHKMLITDGHKKSWARVFSDRKGLPHALAAIYQRSVLTGTDGGAMRLVFADFLDEAAPLLDKPELTDAARAYRHAAQSWQALAQTAISGLSAETQKAINHRATLYNTAPDDGYDNLVASDTRVRRLLDDHDTGFTPDLLERLAAGVELIYNAEQHSLAQLRHAMQS